MLGGKKQKETQVQVEQTLENASALIEKNKQIQNIFDEILFLVLAQENNIMDMIIDNDLMDIIISYLDGVKILDIKNSEQLEAVLSELISDSEVRKHKGTISATFVQNNTGAVATIMKNL